MKRSQFDELFPLALKPGVISPFMHKGEWAIHDVLPFLLQLFGPSKVMLSSFSVSEESLRALFFEGPRLTGLQMLLDTTVKRYKLDLLLFASGFTPNIRIDSCHAKVLLVEGSDHCFGIVGSANLNLNHRWESGFYFTKGEHFNYFKEKFTEAYTNAIPYDIDQ